MKVIQLKELIILLLLSVSLYFSSINSLPVLDRDEARYVQASKQMIESNNYFSIKFQDEYRSKKPIGIYWLQTIPVKLLAKIKQVNKFKNEVSNDAIWQYRLVSANAVLLSILFLFFLSKPIFSKEERLNASLILGCSLLVIAEAHIAKTDAVLLLLNTIMFLTLLKYFKDSNNKRKLNFILFWGSLGLSILIKGPLLIIFLFISIILICIFEKSIDWFKTSRPFLGLVIVILIALPWFLLMPIEEQKNFIQESLLHDFLGKIISAQESHGAFPGFHTLGLWVFFFPFSIFFVPLLNFLRISYKDKTIVFLIFWILPCLIIMEIIPTKLPHYILPIYPAIALLMSKLLSNTKHYKHLFFSKIAYLGYLIYFLISNGLLLFLFKCTKIYGEVNNITLIKFLILFILNNMLYVPLFRRKIKYTFYYLVLFANIFSAIIYISILPSLNMLWVSTRINDALEKNYYLENKNTVAVMGYNEPSLVFTVGTKIRVFKSVEDLIVNFNNYDYLIIEKDYYLKFNEIVKDINLRYDTLDMLKGFNGSKGKWIEVFILKKIMK